MHRTQLFLLAGLLVSVAACGSDPAPAAKSAAGSDGMAGPQATPPAGARADTKSLTSGSVTIDERIVKACGDVPDARFAFDSAAITGDAETALSAVARCFSTGPLKGKNLKLVGHADPRGEPGYNMALGQDRASAVAAFMGTKGLGESRISSMSKGEIDSSGTDEEGWARDRRVDVLLAD